MKEKHELTIKQLEEHKTELEHLIYVELPNNASDIASARAQGDLSENAEYEIAKDEHIKLLERKSRLENILNNYVLIQKSEQNDEVSVGHKVTFVDTETGEIETITILGQREGEDTVSAASPLGAALIGGKIGETRIVEAPEKDFYYMINSIE